MTLLILVIHCGLLLRLIDIILLVDNFTSEPIYTPFSVIHVLKLRSYSHLQMITIKPSSSDSIQPQFLMFRVNCLVKLTMR